jgi:hypothetical protein
MPVASGDSSRRVRIYYDKNGRPRGYSRSLLGTWFWNGSLIGLFIQFCLAVFLLPLYWFPRAVWRSGLAPAAKLMVIAGVWGALILVGVLANTHTASEAQAAGCIDIATAPKDYYDPSGGNNNCPDGYELGPGSITCAVIGSDPPSYTDPTGYDPGLGPTCPSGSETAPKPGPGYTAPYEPPLPSVTEQQAACAGHQGAETGPDFPPPVVDGSHYIVSCMDGTLTDVP